MATILASLTIYFLCLSTLSSIQASKAGFSIELIHRDSPKSPLYNPLETRYQRATNALQRSVNRASRFNSSKSSISPQATEAKVYMNGADYLMKISIGTPPVDILGVADTGSDLIWTQCQPCDNCFTQVAPIFDPTSSTTYEKIPCISQQCASLSPATSCGQDGGDLGTCLYHYQYGDKSYTNGNLALDTITLGSMDGQLVPFPGSIFGCGHDNAGTFDSKTSGIIGLGGGPVSLVSQMGSSIDGKFSYCLLPIYGSSSTLNFGSNAMVKGPGVQSTPLVSKNPATFYFLTLESFSVGTRTINYFGGSFSGPSSEGNIIIDSGTTFSLIPSQVHSEMVEAVEQAMVGTRVNNPSLNLCYASDSISVDKIPPITAHFSGADVTLDPRGTFVGVSEGVLCFAFVPNDSIAVFGNLAQVNYLVAYDLVGKTVSFKQTDCSTV